MGCKYSIWNVFLASQCEKVYLKHFNFFANDKMLFKVYFCLNKRQESIWDCYGNGFWKDEKLMKILGVFDILSLKTMT